jgi:hypothetical protein
MKTGKKLLDDLLTELKIGLDGVYGSRLKGLIYMDLVLVAKRTTNPI